MVNNESIFTTFFFYGNTYLNSYKFTKFLGQNSIRYLSKIYRDSEWMLECGRGQSLLEELDGKHKTDFENFPEELILIMMIPFLNNLKIKTNQYFFYK